MTTDVTPHLVKIAFELQPEDWHDIPVETVWAELLSSEEYGPFTARILNTPFMVEGVSYYDIIFFQISDITGQRIFCGVVARGGHSTFMLTSGKIEITKHLLFLKLTTLGCGFETQQFRSNGKQFIECAINIPPNVNIYEADNIFREGIKEGIWTIQQRQISHTLK